MGKLSALKEGIEKAAKALDMSQAARNFGGPANAEEIKKIIDEDDYFESFGIRVIPKGEKRKVGDFLEKSYAWEDGIQTDEMLPGTSTIGVLYNARQDNVENAMRTLIDNGYVGDEIALVGGVPEGAGTDIGEELISDAKVLALWDREGNRIASLAPAAVGTGIAALGLSPDETQAAINRYMQTTQGSNPILDNLNRNLQQFGMNERGVTVTGEIKKTPFPGLMALGENLRKVQTPLGPVFGGLADYLGKVGGGEDVTYLDRLGASLDVIP